MEGNGLPEISEAPLSLVLEKNRPRRQHSQGGALTRRPLAGPEPGAFEGAQGCVDGGGGLVASGF